MKIFGQHETNTVLQLQQCIDAEVGSRGVLCADGHVGYSQPIGGVVAYQNHVSVSGVGYDIGCGNMAVRTNIRYADIEQADRERIADEIYRRVSFGVGRKNNEPVDDPVFDLIRISPVPQQRGLLELAKSQLGTVGSGNHYVDILESEDGFTYVGVHFGSRGLGHKTATMFLNIAQGLAPDARSHDGEMMSPPLLLDTRQPSGQDYVEAMAIAGEYAYAGRRHVVAKVLDILGAKSTYDEVHNHHNYAWRETHGGVQYWVVRKGATPAAPGQRGFIGGSMGDLCVIVKGIESAESAEALYSTVHGAGRVMSRTQAAGKRNRKTGEIKKPGVVDWDAAKAFVAGRGTILRGAGADEAPQCYRPLESVLDAHKDTIVIEQRLMPRIVVMAGHDVYDPFKD